MSAMQSDKHVERSISDVLAKERTREAAERTLLAGIRTSSSLIIFGFGIYKVVHALSHDMNHRHPMTVVLGLSFIVLGIFSMIAATVQHIQIPSVSFAWTMTCISPNRPSDCLSPSP